MLPWACGVPSAQGVIYSSLSAVWLGRWWIFFFSPQQKQTDSVRSSRRRCLDFIHSYCIPVLFLMALPKHNTVAIMHGGDRLPAPKSTLLFFTSWAYIYAGDSERRLMRLINDQCDVNVSGTHTGARRSTRIRKIFIHICNSFRSRTCTELKGVSCARSWKVLIYAETRIGISWRV